MLLKIAHGDVYTNLKLFKFRLKDSPRCDNCGQIESLTHKFITCGYVAQIWKHTFRLTDPIRSAVHPNEELSNKCLGMVAGTDPRILTIHAEILTRLHYLKNDNDYLIHPKLFIKLALGYLLKREKSEIKNLVKDLLEEI